MPALARAAALIATVAAVVAACDTGDGRDLRPPTSDERADVPTTTTTTSSLPGVPLDVAGRRRTLADDHHRPGVLAAAAVGSRAGRSTSASPATARTARRCSMWTAPPAGTVEMALLVTDDDADGFVHWAVAGIPPSSGENGEGAQITGALEGHQRLRPPRLGRSVPAGRRRRTRTASGSTPSPSRPSCPTASPAPSWKPSPAPPPSPSPSPPAPTRPPDDPVRVFVLPSECRGADAGRSALRCTRHSDGVSCSA